MSEEIKMSKADVFKKWKSERMGHPFHVLLASEAIMELEGEIDTLTEQVKQLREGLECMVLKFAYQDFDTSPLPINEQQEEVAHAMQLLEATK